MNYFVMVKGMKEMDYTPEITSKKLPSSMKWQPYKENLNYLYGKGVTIWKVVSGNLPKGLELCECGILSGLAEKSGDYNFVVKVTDSYGDSSTSSLSIHID